MLKLMCLHCFDRGNILIWECITSGVTADIQNFCNQNKRDCSLIQISLIGYSPDPDSSARVCKSFCVVANLGESVNVRRLVLLWFECCLLLAIFTGFSYLSRLDTNYSCTYYIPKCWPYYFYITAGFEWVKNKKRKEKKSLDFSTLIFWPA